MPHDCKYSAVFLKRASSLRKGSTMFGSQTQASLIALSKLSIFSQNYSNLNLRFGLHAALKAKCNGAWSDMDDDNACMTASSCIRSQLTETSARSVCFHVIDTYGINLKILNINETNKSYIVGSLLSEFVHIQKNVFLNWKWLGRA
jgi:hypothetical protein